MIWERETKGFKPIKVSSILTPSLSEGKVFMVMQMTRIIHVQALELMLDLGNTEWCTIYVIGPRAWVVPPDKRATEVLLKNRSKQREISDFLLKEYGASVVAFPSQ